MSGGESHCIGGRALRDFDINTDYYFSTIIAMYYVLVINKLSSPRAKRAGPKGLPAESARAVTGRRCPHSGEGEDFLTHLFTKMAITQKLKAEKSISRWEMDRLSLGYKGAVDQNWGRMAKIRFLDQKPRFWAQKKTPAF